MILVVIAVGCLVAAAAILLWPRRREDDVGPY